MGVDHRHRRQDRGDGSGRIGARISILNRYHDAVDTYQAGISSFESARANLRRENYHEAESDALSARDRFESARERFARERRRARAIEVTDAAETLDENWDLCDRLAEASDHLATAAAAYAGGDDERGSRYYEDARSIYGDTFDETVVSNSLRSELGF
jgi:hypothetical protein